MMCLTLLLNYAVTFLETLKILLQFSYVTNCKNKQDFTPAQIYAKKADFLCNGKTIPCLRIALYIHSAVNCNVLSRYEI